MSLPQPLPQISESEVSAEHADSIKEVAEAAGLFLGLDLETASTETVIERVDDFIHQLQHQQASAPEGEEAEIFFGCLWGEQLVREFGWEWANVTFHEHGDVKALGVFSPDRSLAIYPFHFLIGCLENEAPVTIMLAFNILCDASRVPELPPRGYENVMDHVHPIVPRQ